MLTEHTTGKFLSAEYHKDLQDAIADPTSVSADVLDYLEVSATDPRRNVSGQFEIKTDPVDPADDSCKEVDVRVSPQIGGDA